MKRIIAGFLAFIMIIALCAGSVGAKQTSLIDVPSDHWAYEDVHWALENGITNGVSASSFAPGMSLTRATFVTFLSRLNVMLGKDSTPKAGCAFTDVNMNSWYYDSICWANENGVVEGMTSSTFEPETLINREQMATILYRYLTSVAGKSMTKDSNWLTYTDRKNISVYARDAVSAISSHDAVIMNGSGNEFLPDQSATRAQAVAVIKRTYDYLNQTNEKHFLGNLNNTSTPSFDLNNYVTDFTDAAAISRGLLYLSEYDDFKTVSAYDPEFDESAAADSFGLQTFGMQLSNNSNFLYFLVIENAESVRSDEKLHIYLDPYADFKQGDNTNSLIEIICSRSNDNSSNCKTIYNGQSFNSNVSYARYMKISQTQYAWEIRFEKDKVDLKDCNVFGVDLQMESISTGGYQSISYLNRYNGTYGIGDAQNWGYITFDGADKEAPKEADSSDTTLHPVILTNSEKICRDDIQENNKKKELTAHLAKNEAEGLQFLLWNGAGAKNVSYSVSPLANDQGETIDNVTLYREHYMNVEESYTGGAPKGWFPDALIPLFDGSDGGFDNHVSDIEPMQNQGYWFTVRTSKDQTPGIYTGNVTVKYDGGEDIRIPITITVWDLDMPDESSSMNCFSTWRISNYYYEVAQLTSNENDRLSTVYNENATVAYNLQMMYYEFFLNYRLSDKDIPSTTKYPHYGYTTSDIPVAIQEIIDVASDPRVSAFRFPVACDYGTYSMNSAQRSQNIQVYNALKEAGIADKAYLYILDEPTSNDLEVVKTRTNLGKTLDGVVGAHIPNLVTTDTVNHSEFAPYITDWCPNWGKMSEAQTRELMSTASTVWWYSCIGPTYPAVTYQIPDSLISPRIAHWMQMDVGVTGELYWATTQWYYYFGSEQYKVRDVWNQAEGHDAVGSCGDGYLVYPGTDIDGIVNRNIPIPTVRLEAIRDGMEDYEMYQMQAKKLQDTIDRLGITNVTTDDLLNTYYQAVYNVPQSGNTVYADFDYNNADLVMQVRDILAQDVMRDSNDSIVAVNKLSDSKKEIVVYTKTKQAVIVNGTHIAGTFENGHYVYRYSISANVDTISTINVDVGEETYTRVLNYKY